MRNFKEILILLNQGFSFRFISANKHISRDSIRKIVEFIQSNNLEYSELIKLSNEEINSILFPKKVVESIYDEPDFEKLSAELGKKGVTIKLLWEEYRNRCIENDKIFYQYSTFRKKMSEYTMVNQATMHFNHEPGKKIEVDWAGQTINIFNPIDGTISKAYLFIGVLPFSQYTYAEFTTDMTQESWINVHVNMFNYFGGSTPIIVCDNLKTGVVKNDRSEIILNKYYDELANYYSAAVVPSNPRKPKGKATVEGMVGKLTTQIVGRLRNEIYNSVYEANLECMQILSSFNKKPFQKLDGSRYEIFINEEKKHLQPLPKIPFEYGEWKMAKVQKNYHITILKQNYSVPFKYIGQTLKVKITSKMVYIYDNLELVATHIKLRGKNYQYSTKESHLPETHIKANNWNGEYFRKWAKIIGPNTFIVVDNLLKNYHHEEQGYKGVNALLCLANTYNKQSLESACTKALTLVSIPRYNNIKKLIEYSQVNDDKKSVNNEDSYIRGEKYFGDR